MERPAKRQKLSSHASNHQAQLPSASRPDRLLALPNPTPTIDLANFQRPYLDIQQGKLRAKRRNLGRIIRPRVPDVTVTTGILEVAVNGGSTSTQIAVPTTATAVTLTNLGTLTVPAQTASSESSTSSRSVSDSVSSSVASTASESGSESLTSSTSASVESSQSRESISTSITSSTSSSSSIISTSTRNNSTLLNTVSPSDRTTTITSTSTFHVSFTNGTFIAPTSTTYSDQSGSVSSSLSSESDTSTSTSGTYTFGVSTTSSTELTTTTTAITSLTGGSSRGSGVTATGTAGTGSRSDPTSSSVAGNGSDTSSGGGGGSSSSEPVLTPQQTQMVGGIVGGLAGMALIAVVLLYLLRRYKQRRKANGHVRPIDFDPSHDHGASGLVDAAAPMSHSTHSLLAPPPNALVTTPKKWRRGSDIAALTVSTAESEKSFQRVSGRKIPSVLSTGGDQFGGSYGAFDEKLGMAVSNHTFPVPPYPNRSHHHHQPSDSSIYSDHDNPYLAHYQQTTRSAPTTPIHAKFNIHNNTINNNQITTTTTHQPRRPTLTHTQPSYYQMEDLTRALTADIAIPRPDGFAVIRNSPARTPMTESPSASSIVLPIHTPVMMDEDAPEMPLSPSAVVGYGFGNGQGVGYGYTQGQGQGYGVGLGLGHDLMTTARRVPSRVGERSGSAGGRFREDGL